MSYQNEYDEDEREDRQPPPGAADEPAASLFEQLGFGVSTFLAAGAVDMCAHFGLTGLVVGGIAAYAASQHGPDLLAQVKGAWAPRPAPATRRTRPHRPAPRLLAAEGRTGRRRRSILDRALGRFPDAPAPLHEAEEEDIVYFEEADVLAYEGRKHTSPLVPVRHRREALLDLSPELQVPVHDLAGKAIFICGIRRHGKTTLGALLAEQLGRYDLPLVIPDLEGDYLSLAEVLPRAVIAGHSCAASQHTACRYDGLDSASEIISDAWEVTKTYAGRIGEWVLFLCMVMNILEILVTLPLTLSNIVLGTQVVMLDVGGFSLATMGEQARDRGDHRAARRASLTGYFLIGVTIVTLLLVTVGLLWSPARSYTDEAEKGLNWSKRE